MLKIIKKVLGTRSANNFTGNIVNKYDRVDCLQEL